MIPNSSDATASLIWGSQNLQCTPLDFGQNFLPKILDSQDFAKCPRLEALYESNQIARTINHGVRPPREARSNISSFAAHLPWHSTLD